MFPKLRNLRLAAVIVGTLITLGDPASSADQADEAIEFPSPFDVDGVDGVDEDPTGNRGSGRSERLNDLIRMNRSGARAGIDHWLRSRHPSGCAEQTRDLMNLCAVLDVLLGKQKSNLIYIAHSKLLEEVPWNELIEHLRNQILAAERLPLFTSDPQLGLWLPLSSQEIQRAFILTSNRLLGSMLLASDTNLI